jgi:hypothetical protein
MAPLLALLMVLPIPARGVCDAVAPLPERASKV